MRLLAHKGAATVHISRVGVDSDISKPVDSDAVVSGYGKTSEDTWEVVATEPVVRIYQSGRDPEQDRVSGGTYDTDSPVLIFIRDSSVTEGYRISYQNTEYEIDSLKIYPTHLEATTTVVN